MASSLKITRHLDNVLPIAGALAVAAVQHKFVQVKDPEADSGVSSVHDAPEFELADGTKKGYPLMRAVIDETSMPLEKLVFGNDLISPVLVDQVVEARVGVLELEVEGTDYLTAGLIADGAVGDQLTFEDGKLALAPSPYVSDETQQICGRIAGTLEPEDGDNTVRFLVELNP